MNDAGPTYADCPAVEVEAVVDAPVPVVWSLVVDIGLPARFSAEFQGAEWLDGATEPAVGARFVGRNVHPIAGSWQTVCTIANYEPRRRFGYMVSGLVGREQESPAATWRFELEPMSEARVRVRYRARIGPGPSLLNRVIDANPAGERQIVAVRLAELRHNMTATVLGIKDIAERQGLNRSGPRQSR